MKIQNARKGRAEKDPKKEDTFPFKEIEQRKR
jgi:hypothetical protein